MGVGRRYGESQIGVGRSGLVADEGLCCLAEECRQGVRGGRVDAVVDVCSAAFAVDESGFSQGLEVVGDGGRVEFECGCDLTHGQLGPGGDHGHQPESDRVAQGFEHRGGTVGSLAAESDCIGGAGRPVAGDVVEGT